MTRTTISLDGTWQLITDPEDRLSPASLAAGRSWDVQVPGPWQAQHAELRRYTGVAWYRRAVELPPGAAAGRSWYLRFGAVDYHAAVWLNGHLLGEHEGGYLPFELRADHALAPGANELVVRVFDPGPASAQSPYPFEEVPHGKQSWYGPLGGIWQSVTLEARDPLHMASLKVTPAVQEERAHMALTLSQPAPAPLQLHIALTAPDGGRADHAARIETGESAAHIPLPIAEPQLWDIGAPNLYTLAVSLLSRPDGQPIDSLAVTFGMRTIAASAAGQLVLNGRPIYLRGALDQDYYPELICTAFSDAELDQQFARARHMGLNCVRTHIKIADPRYYAAADRAGILIWTELPNWELLSDAAKGRARATLQGMVERDWNHPSIIIWTIINEGWGVDLMGNPEHRAWLAETYSWLKALDPTRLVVGNSACEGNFHVVTDLEDFHNYYAMPDHYDKWRAWVNSFAGRAPWSFAHVIETYADYRRYRRAPWAERERQSSPEARRGGAEPLLVSEFGNWGLPDLAQLKARYGGEPWWFETGFEWGEGAVYPHGIEQRFAAFHLDRVFGDLAGLAAASQRAQYAALKEQIEQLRRHPTITGYVITELTDVHWEANGLLDMWRNPKAYYDTIGALNADDLLIPLWERTAYWSGAALELPVMLSHYSQRSLAGARLEWRLTPWEGLHGATEVPAPETPVAPVAVVRARLPSVEQPTRARVDLRLCDPAGATIALGSQELYVIPQRAAPPTAIYAPEADLAQSLADLGYRPAGAPADAQVVVTAILTPELRRYAQQGGRVLLLAENLGALRAHLDKIAIKARRGRSWQGDWASSLSWVRPDGMFRSIPSGGLVDFGFANLTPDYVITGVAPREYPARVHAGLFVGWVHHSVAIVAERPIGRGSVLISTFRLREHLAANPLAQELIHAMIAHLAAPGVERPAAG